MSNESILTETRRQLGRRRFPSGGWALAGSVVALLLAPAAAYTATVTLVKVIGSPLNWSGMRQIDTRAQFGLTSGIIAIPCPSTSLCVATGGGSIDTTSDPRAASPVWLSDQVGDGSLNLGRISCPAATPCVATQARAAGHILRSRASAAGGTVYALDSGVCCSGSPGDVWQFTTGTGGALSPLSPASVSIGGYGSDIAVSPDGRSVYVTEYTTQGTPEGLVAQFNVGASGTLSPKSPATIAAGNRAGAVVVSPDGKSVYVDDPGNGVIWQYDVGAGGVLKPKSAASTGGTSVCTLRGTGLSITSSSTDVFLARDNPGCSTSIAQLTADSKGQLSETSEASTSNTVSDLVVSADGKSLYAVTGFFGGNTVYQFNIGKNGQLTPKSPASVPAPIPANGLLMSMAIGPNGKNLYVLADNGGCNTSGGTSVVLHYPLGTSGLLGSPTSAAASKGSTGIGAVALSGDDKSLYVAQGECLGSGGSSMLQYNVATNGTLSPRSPFGVPAGANMVAIAVRFVQAPPTPTISKLSPNKGPTSGGTIVTITGTNLLAPSAVHFGSAVAKIDKVVSATAIEVTSPKGNGTVDVTVTTSGGTSAKAVADRFSYVPTPTVAKLSPNKGPTSGGTIVTITGTNLLAPTAVHFGAAAAKIDKVVSSTEIEVTSPKGGTGTVDVTVNTAGGTSAKTAADRFAY